MVAGDDAGSPARVLAQEAGWPLLAEPSSGSRNGDNVVRCYRLLARRQSSGSRSSASWSPATRRCPGRCMRLLSRADVEVVDMSAGGLPRPFEVSSTAVEPRTDGADDPAWLAAWHEADASVSRQLDALLAAEAGLTPYAVAGAVSRAVPAGGLLVVGASSPVRDLDLMATAYDVGGRRKVIANRGLSGIDGTVSTAIGPRWVGRTARAASR